MGIIIKQSLQNTLISYIGVGLGFITTIFLYPNILAPEEYGLTRVLISIAFVAAQLASLGLGNTIVRFFPYFKDKNKDHHGFLILVILIGLAGFLLFTGLFFLFREQLIRYNIEQSQLFQNYYIYLVPLVFFLLFFNLLTSYIRALLDTVLSSFLIDVLLRVVLIINLAIYFLGWISFNVFILIFTLNYGLQLLLLILYLMLQQDVRLEINFSKLTRPLIQKMTSYSIYAFFGGLATIVVAHIDIIMLGSLAGLEQTGIYAIAFYIGMVISIPQKSIQKISMPIVSEAFKEGNISLIEDIYRRSALNQIIAGGLLFIGVWANLDNLMHLLPPEYESGGLIILIIGAANLFDMSTGINSPIILTSKHYRFDFYTTLFLVFVTIAMNYLLIPVYGITGAAIATGVSLLLYNMIKYFFVWIKLSLQPFRLNIIPIIFIGVLVLSLSLAIGEIGNVYIDIFFRSILVAAMYLGPIYYLNLSEDFTRLVHNSFKRLSNYFSSRRT